jgi:hypothetical protein
MVFRFLAVTIRTSITNIVKIIIRYAESAIKISFADLRFANVLMDGNNLRSKIVNKCSEMIPFDLRLTNIDQRFRKIAVAKCPAIF